MLYSESGSKNALCLILVTGYVIGNMFSVCAVIKKVSFEGIVMKMGEKVTHSYIFRERTLFQPSLKRVYYLEKNVTSNNSCLENLSLNFRPHEKCEERGRIIFRL